MAIPQNHHERLLTTDETREILALQEKDITASLICKYFARQQDGSEPRFYTNNYFKLPTSKFGTKKEVYTTIGIYIFNLFIIQPHFKELFGYVNKPITSSMLEEIEGALANSLYNDKITTDSMADYYNRIQWLGGDRAMSILSPSLTDALLKSPKDIIKRRDELFKKYAKELQPNNKNNAIVAANIEKELILLAQEYIKTIDGAENFDSKAKINVGNHYKNMNIMKGAVLSSYDGKYRINRSNYNDGIDKDEYASFSDSATLGAYKRAVNTAQGGYLAKEANQGMMNIKAAPKGSDCRTPKCRVLTLNPKSKKEFLNRYIVVSGKGLVELTEENWSQYAGKEVNMRSPMYCQQQYPCYCNICLGNQPYLLNLENFGLTCGSKIANRILDISMKAFHDSTVKTTQIDTSTLFID